MDARTTLAQFDITSIPTLDVAVMGAFELFTAEPVSPLVLPFSKPLVLGSGNAFLAAQIIFADTAAVFADETTYEAVLHTADRFDGVIVMSASGGKHAVPMVEAALRTGLITHLITNNAAAPAAALLPRECTHVYVKNREPYTYNTSTYLGPILAHTGEDSATIATYLASVVESRLLRNFGDYRGFVFLIPPQFHYVRSMLRTKFDELFGAQLVGRFFTPEEAKHAKTVVVSGDELFISFGVDNQHFGLVKNRLYIPVPEASNYGLMMAATYFVVGKIQAAHPPYFAQSITAYAKVASELFGHTITPIVE